MLSQSAVERLLALPFLSHLARAYEYTQADGKRLLSVHPAVVSKIERRDNTVCFLSYCVGEFPSREKLSLSTHLQFTVCLTHSLPHLPTYPCTHSSIHSLIHALTHPCTHSSLKTKDFSLSNFCHTTLEINLTPFPLNLQYIILPHTQWLYR